MADLSDPSHSLPPPVPASEPPFEEPGGLAAMLAHVLLSRPARYVACWLVALAAAGFAAEQAWDCWNDPQRRDGNWGHCTIDFCGQYLMARMFATGHGRELYSRKVQEQVLAPVLPDSDGRPEGPSDLHELMSWIIAAPMGVDHPDWVPGGPEHRDLGGPLYPPVHGLLFSPLGWLNPRPAYRILQGVILLLTFYCGWVVERLSGGRAWCPIAAVLLMLFPGYNGTLNLAQNPIFSLSLLLTGWWQLQRGRPFLAGVLWGFLAFKPVWAVAFLLPPLLARRWRFLAAMVLTGAALIVATLPFVGIQVWFDWLEVGKVASWEYSRQESWTILARDLVTLPRRWLLSFHDGVATNPEDRLAHYLGMYPWLGVVGITVAIALWRRKQVHGTTGAGAAFLLLGGYFTCYHFMYYDVMLAALPVALLFTNPAQYLQPVFLGRSNKELLPVLLRYYRPTWDYLTPPPMPLLPGGLRPRWVVNPFPPLALLLLLALPPLCIRIDPSYHFPPMDTFVLLAIWTWAGAHVVAGRNSAEEG